MPGRFAPPRGLVGALLYVAVADVDSIEEAVMLQHFYPMKSTFPVQPDSARLVYLSRLRRIYD